MSIQAKPTLIGAFVAGALVILTATLFVLGGGSWFSEKQEFVVYFSESVNGLNVGAPVKFRGVQIGEVKKILIHYNQPKDSLAIPVVLTIDTTQLERRTAGRAVAFGDDKEFEQAIREGLRAKMDFQSFVTGVFYVELDFYDDVPAPVFLQLEPIYPEIPALTSTTADLMESVKRMIRNIGQIDFKRIGERLDSTLGTVDAGLKEVDFKAINARLVSALTRADEGLAALDFKGVNAKVMKTLDGADSLLNDTKLRESVEKLHEALSNANRAFVTVNDMLKSNSTLRYELDSMLEEMTGAARAFRQLADYLDRNPSALLTGRSDAE